LVIEITVLVRLETVARTHLVLLGTIQSGVLIKGKSTPNALGFGHLEYRLTAQQHDEDIGGRTSDHTPQASTPFCHQTQKSAAETMQVKLGFGRARVAIKADRIS
jgi:hypothetical protein